MESFSTKFKTLELPGLEGELKSEKPAPETIAKLGNDYARHHEFLRARLEELGGRPDPKDYKTPEAFYDAWERGEEILRAEALLRVSFMAVKKGKSPLASPDTVSAPLLDEDNRLQPLPAARIK